MCIHEKIWNLKTKTTNAVKGGKKGTGGEEMKIVISDKLKEESKN